MRLSREHVEQIISYCRAGLPNEACGLLAGEGDTVTAVHGVENARHSPFAYELGEDGYRLVLELDEAGRLLGCFHSHTESEAYPSPSDRRQAFWPIRYVIVSLSDSEHPALRAFRFVKQEGAPADVVEEAVEVI
jgi:proteasome lid subunit RPN8/RPN11